MLYSFIFVYIHILQLLNNFLHISVHLILALKVMGAFSLIRFVPSKHVNGKTHYICLQALSQLTPLSLMGLFYELCGHLQLIACFWRQPFHPIYIFLLLQPSKFWAEQHSVSCQPFSVNCTLKGLKKNSLNHKISLALCVLSVCDEVSLLYCVQNDQPVPSNPRE